MRPYRLHLNSCIQTLSTPPLLPMPISQQSNELLLSLLDGPFKVLRDDNHIDPTSLLVWDTLSQPVIQAIEFPELLRLYPCGRSGAQWMPDDYVAILQEKWDQYRKSVASHEISDDAPTLTPMCGTVVLIVNPNPLLPHRWVSVNALIEPGQ